MDATPIIIKKKKSHGHAHHGGSWKVAYADFVTAMMAFFMVMWIMGLSEDTKTKIQGYFNDPINFMKSQAHGSVVISPKSMPISKPGQSAP
ncbi:MAG TPA: flagellar motor protein MotB, partial [Fimbriimonadaceae bacterium]|nr:flagellar motor protein MotB [Fimbriimonadaceae bacterium]